MYIREIHIENIRGFRSGNRSVRLDLTRPDGSLAGWTVFAGRNGEDKTTLLRAIALSIVGPKGSYALQDSFADWLHAGTTRGLTRAQLVPSEGDTVKAGAPPRRTVFWSGLEWQPLSESTEAFATPVDGEVASVGPWDETSSGWFVAGYGPFRRLGGRALHARHLIEGPSRLARLVSLFHDDSSPSESLSWLRNVYLRRLGGDPDLKEAKDFEHGILQLLDQGLLPRGMTVDKVHSDGLWVRRNGLRLPLRDLGRSASIVAALTLDLARQFCPSLADFRLEQQGNRWVVPYEGVVLLDAFDTHLHGSWRAKAGVWLKTHFPRVQFLVTAYSPFVCQAADARGIVWMPTAAEDRAPAHVSEGLFKALVNGTAEEAILAEMFGLEYLEASPWEEVRDNLMRSARGARSSRRGAGTKNAPAGAAAKNPPAGGGSR
jgi:hypothetical protein